MKNRVITERILVVGDARVQEGDEAFVRFLSDEKECWIFGMFALIWDTFVSVYTNSGQHHRISIDDILDITDGKLPLTAKEAKSLIAGETIFVR